MIGFFWTAGRLGWGLFAALAFSGTWLLLVDLVWRLGPTTARRLTVVAASGWIIGLGLIVLVYWTARS